MNLKKAKLDRNKMSDNLKKLINDIVEVQALFVLGEKIIPVLQDLFVFLQEILPLLQDMHESILTSYEKMPQMSKQLDTITNETEIATTQILDLIDTLTEKAYDMGDQINISEKNTKQTIELLGIFTKDMDRILKINKMLLEHSTLPEEELSQIKKESVALILNLKEILHKSKKITDEMQTTFGDLKNKIEDIQNDIFLIMNSLQFQDITAQQIQHANSIMDMVEDKLYSLLSNFTSVTDIERIKKTSANSPMAYKTTNRAFDPNATIKDATERQAIADSVLAGNIDDDNTPSDSSNNETLSQEELDKLLSSGFINSADTETEDKSQEETETQVPPANASSEHITSQEELDKLFNSGLANNTSETPTESKEDTPNVNNQNDNKKLTSQEEIDRLLNGEL